MKEIGYTKDYSVLVKVSKQSQDISSAIVNEIGEGLADNQDIMFGYACDETDSFMPAPIYYAHKLAE